MAPTPKKRNKKYVPKQIIVTNHVTRREFVYTLGDVKLDFKLRTDVKNELEDFKALMLIGIKDIDAELEKLTTKK